MDESELLDELVGQFCEAAEKGVAVSAAELCRNCNCLHLLPALEMRLQGLRLMKAGGMDVVPAQSGQIGLALEPGQRVADRYELVEELGRGGFGTVWKTRTTSGTEVALKFVPRQSLKGRAELNALDRIKHLRHVNLLALFDYWELDGWLVICTQLAERTLEDRLKEAKNQGYPGIPVGELLKYMRGIAHALDFLRRHDIQHCDVKPSNILLIGRNAVLGDFSLATQISKSKPTGFRIGTKEYAPPEFATGRVTARSDQYSLAVIYYVLRFGTLPFRTAAETVDGSSPNVKLVPKDERVILARTFAHNPSERYRSCGEFVRALANTDAALMFREWPFRHDSFWANWRREYRDRRRQRACRDKARQSDLFDILYFVSLFCFDINSLLFWLVLVDLKLFR